MARFRSKFRRGTVSYERQLLATRSRRRTLAEARAKQAVKPEVKRRAQRQAATARRSIREMPARISQAEARREFHDQLNPHDQRVFDGLPARLQQQFHTTRARWPDGVPQDQPNPFASAGSHHNVLWRLLYGTSAGRRARLAA